MLKRGWSGGVMMPGKLLVPGRPTTLDKCRARAYCACSRCGWGLFGHFSLFYHSSFLSPSLWETIRYRLKYCLQGPKQPTNQFMSNKIGKLSLYANCPGAMINTHSLEIRIYSQAPASKTDHLNPCVSKIEIDKGMRKEMT